MAQELTATRRPLLLRFDPPMASDCVVGVTNVANSPGVDGVEWVHRCPELSSSSAADGEASDVHLPLFEGSSNAIAWECRSVRVDDACRDLAAILDAAAGRACWVELTIPPLAGDHSAHGFGRYQDALNFAYDLLRGIRFAAESSGLVVALEACARGVLLSPVELRELLSAVHSSAVGACVDVARVAVIGSPDDWLRTLGGKVFAVRLAPTAASLGALEQVLDEIRYGGPIILDPGTTTAEIPPALIRLARGVQEIDAQ